MIARTIYPSPLGLIYLAADDEGLLEAWFEGQKDLEPELLMADGEDWHPVLAKARAWLEAYFSNQALPEDLALTPKGTAFQQSVWQALLQIPKGQTISYGQLAENLSCGSAQAVGQAVGHNPLLIFIPCHRVLGSQGELTGYAAGLERKAWLLAHEGHGGKID